MNKENFALLVIVAVVSGLTGGAISTFLLMPPSVLAQDGPQKVIEAEQFRVVDQDGNTRAKLGTGELGTYLNLFDVKNQVRVMLTVNESKPTLILLHNDATTSGVPMTLFTNQGPSIQIYDSENQLRTALGTIQLKNAGTGSTEIRASSSLLLCDEEGNVVWPAP